MDNNSMKTRSIRADETVLNKFKELSEQFDNQSDCLNSLITAYELNNSKHILTEVKTDITDFETHLNSIQQAFLHSLELNAGAEERIRQEFKRQLESKDNSIINLQEQLEEMKLQVEIANNRVEAINNELTEKKIEIELQHNDSVDLRNTIAQLNYEIDSKQEIISTLTERIPDTKELESKVAELNQSLEEKAAQLKINSAKIEELETLNKNIQREKEIEFKELKLNLREEYQEQLEKINSDHNNTILRLNEKIDRLQDKITELTAKLQEQRPEPKTTE